MLKCFVIIKLRVAKTNCANNDTRAKPQPKVEMIKGIIQNYGQLFPSVTTTASIDKYAHVDIFKLSRRMTRKAKKLPANTSDVYEFLGRYLKSN